MLRRERFSRARLEPWDITDQTDPDDRRLTKEPADPIEKADRKDPTDPIDRAEPTLPIERMDPFEAIERTEFSEATDHREELGAFIVATITLGHRSGTLRTDPEERWTASPRF